MKLTRDEINAIAKKIIKNNDDKREKEISDYIKSQTLVTKAKVKEVMDYTKKFKLAMPKNVTSISVHINNYLNIISADEKTITLEFERSLRAKYICKTKLILLGNIINEIVIACIDAKDLVDLKKTLSQYKF